MSATLTEAKTDTDALFCMLVATEAELLAAMAREGLASTWFTPTVNEILEGSPPAQQVLAAALTLLAAQARAGEIAPGSSPVEDVARLLVRDTITATLTGDADVRDSYGISATDTSEVVGDVTLRLFALIGDEDCHWLIVGAHQDVHTLLHSPAAHYHPLGWAAPYSSEAAGTRP